LGEGEGGVEERRNRERTRGRRLRGNERRKTLSEYQY